MCIKIISSEKSFAEEFLSIFRNVKFYIQHDVYVYQKKTIETECFTPHSRLKAFYFSGYMYCKTTATKRGIKTSEIIKHQRAKKKVYGCCLHRSLRLRERFSPFFNICNAWHFMILCCTKVNSVDIFSKTKISSPEKHENVANFSEASIEIGVDAPSENKGEFCPPRERGFIRSIFPHLR